MVVSLVRPVFEALGVTDVDLMSLIVRKGAHFSEYAVLGVLARCLYVALRRERASFMTDYPVTFVIIVATVPVVFVPVVPVVVIDGAGGGRVPAAVCARALGHAHGRAHRPCRSCHGRASRLADGAPQAAPRPLSLFQTCHKRHSSVNKYST